MDGNRTHPGRLHSARKPFEDRVSKVRGCPPTSAQDRTQQCSVHRRCDCAPACAKLAVILAVIGRSETLGPAIPSFDSPREQEYASAKSIGGRNPNGQA